MANRSTLFRSSLLFAIVLAMLALAGLYSYYDWGCLIFKDCAIGSTTPGNNQTYDELSSQAKAFGKVKWSPTDYHLLINSIDESLHNKLIDERQRRELCALSETYDLNLLTDSVQHFCATAGADNTSGLKVLYSGVNQIKTDAYEKQHLTQAGSLLALLNTFSNIVSLHFQIDRFAYEQPYSSTQAETYRTKFGSLLTVRFISSNKRLQQLKEESFGWLSDQHNCYNLFNDYSKPINTFPGHSCSMEFKKSKYYMQQCVQMGGNN